MVDFERTLSSGTLRSAGSLLIHQPGQSGFDPRSLVLVNGPLSGGFIQKGDARFQVLFIKRSFHLFDQRLYL